MRICDEFALETGFGGLYEEALTQAIASLCESVVDTTS